MKKHAQGFNTTAQDSNSGSRIRESEALPLNHCALQMVMASHVKAKFKSVINGIHVYELTSICHTMTGFFYE